MELGIGTGQRDGYTHGETERQMERQGERETVSRVKDLLASGVPPKGLEARVNLLELQRVRCWLEGLGLMLCQRVWSDALYAFMLF